VTLGSTDMAVNLNSGPIAVYSGCRRWSVGCDTSLTGVDSLEERAARRDNGCEEERWGDSNGKNFHLLICVLLGGNGAGHEIIVRSERRFVQRDRKLQRNSEKRRKSVKLKLAKSLTQKNIE